MNPGHRSPRDVDRDPDYVWVTEHAVAVLSRHQHMRHIVKHIASETFWACVYEMQMESDEYEYPATWRQVYPKLTTTYEDKPG